MKRSKYLVRGLTCVGALAILPLFTAAQNKPATLEEALAQIETLKKQMAELETYVRGQIQQTATNVPAAAAANVVAKAESKTAPPAAASADSNYVKWNELTV